MLGTMRAELWRGIADNPDDVASWLAYEDMIEAGAWLRVALAIERD